ncbi:type II toxin-antitoxin system ParD family antitoxin [Sphingobium yanoikuyae]|uniref:type II toxin-antitoxin system ParD family antitoxin n=1 Tax=Sphingobium yanoikuyae TaxID=13690 RepID=UPI0022DE28C1|nr:type II toxin-antitoxin system ParD family antitoxin [Sphingobium yanoikuyae]WBQ19055.1 type II toxin-antitoxin system ParD family antitoxin [Sphingobium yanoikuyae]
MSGRQVRTISLSRELDRFISEQVASGYYPNASEVVRAGLRSLAAQPAPAPHRVNQTER